MVEEWKNVGEWPYEVSNSGRVRNIVHKKVICPRMRGSKGGRYPAVNLWDSGRMQTFSVHRLVAIAFLPNPNGGKEVHHKNGNKSDASAENLSWCTRQENELYKTFQEIFI